LLIIESLVKFILTSAAARPIRPQSDHIQTEAKLKSLGNYDLVFTVEGAEETAMTTSLKVDSLGNLRTQTLRGFFAEEMKSLTCNMP